MTASQRRVRFGRFELDPATGELWRDGVPRALQPQPARMLSMLVARAGTLVSRQELRDALWDSHIHVDFERGLNFCVAHIRAALGDTPSRPQFIETVPKKGYRFVAVVQEVPGMPEARGVPARRSPFRRVAVLGLFIAAFAVFGVHAWRAAGSFQAPHVAVVPFDNETGLPDADRIAKGISDAAVAQLASADRLNRLRVIGNAADLRFSFRPRDLKKMGDTLGAQFVVLGQLKHGADGYRVIAHLIRVSDQTHVWATTFDRRTLELTQQSEIAEAIARAVVTRVAGG